MGWQPLSRTAESLTQTMKYEMKKRSHAKVVMTAKELNFPANPLRPLRSLREAFMYEGRFMIQNQKAEIGNKI